MRSTSMSPERYLVALSAQSPALRGFSYAHLDRALHSLVDTRQRWPLAELRVIPAKPPQHQQKCSANTSACSDAQIAALPQPTDLADLSHR